MRSQRRGDLTALLDEVRACVDGAWDRLICAIFACLRHIALVHEVLVRLIDGDTLADVPNRCYLLAAAAHAMLQVLVEHDRHRDAAERAGGEQRVPLDYVLAYFEDHLHDVIVLDKALDRLITLDERQCPVVSLRFYAVLSIRKVAGVLDVPTRTVEDDWRVARVRLRGQLRRASQ
jgi:RNA polymerase sigma factor (TIGR02999 family)